MWPVCLVVLCFLMYLQHPLYMCSVALDGWWSRGSQCQLQLLNKVLNIGAGIEEHGSSKQQHNKTNLKLKLKKQQQNSSHFSNNLFFSSLSSLSLSWLFLNIKGAPQNKQYYASCFPTTHDEASTL